MSVVRRSRAGRVDIHSGHLVIAACLAIVGCETLTGADDGPDQRPISYFRLDSTGWTLYRTTPDRGTPTRIDVGNRQALYPSLSPDGTRLAFISETEPGGLYVSATDGSGARLISSAASTDRIAWSPDGTRLAVGSNGEIIVVGADGANPHSITESVDVYARYPAWSRSNRIAFAAGDGVFESGGIYSMNLDGSDLRLIVDVAGVGVRDPSWSPDGSRLAFAMGPHGRSSIYAVDAGGDGRQRVTPEPGWGFSATDLGPVWSPSGRWIAFQREHVVCNGASCESRGDIFITPVGGGELRNLTAGTPWGGVRPTW